MNKVKVSQYSLLLILPILSLIFAPSALAISRRDRVENRLTEVKLKACQARENAMKTRSTNLTKLVTTMEEKFDAIALRVEKFYTTKIIPSGKTVANYDVLVNNIATKKSDVQTALTKAQDDIAGFSCDGNDPKAQMKDFRLDMQTVKEKLKDYRKSVKDLIVAVHSVTGEIKKASPSASPI